MEERLEEEPSRFLGSLYWIGMSIPSAYMFIIMFDLYSACHDTGHLYPIPSEYGWAWHSMRHYAARGMATILCLIAIIILGLALRKHKTLAMTYCSILFIGLFGIMQAYEPAFGSTLLPLIPQLDGTYCISR